MAATTPIGVDTPDAICRWRHFEHHNVLGRSATTAGRSGERTACARGAGGWLALGLVGDAVATSKSMSSQPRNWRRGTRRPSRNASDWLVSWLDATLRALE